MKQSLYSPAFLTAVFAMIASTASWAQPLAVDDGYPVDEDTPLSITAVDGVLSNDTDPESDPLEAVLVDDVGQGSLTLNADGSFDYTPAMDFIGTDSFTYRASDGSQDSAPATVTLTVTGVGDAPVAADDSYQTTPNQPFSESTATGVLANDTDVDSVSLDAVLVSDVGQGTLTLNADGSFDYAPNLDYSGSDSFTYRANDGVLDSELATVTITITSPPPPVAATDAYGPTEDVLLVTTSLDGVLLNDTDTNGALDITAELVSGPSQGSLQSFVADGGFSYLPSADFTGVDSFVYRAVDGVNGASAEATVTLTVAAVNDAPVAAADEYTIPADATLLVGVADGVLANDTDVDGDLVLDAVVVDDVGHGSLTLNLDGSFGYTPDAGYSGEDVFTYTAGDGSAISDVATVTITVEPEVTAVPGTVVQLALDEGSGVQALDSSGLGNDGSILGGALYETDTADGSAYALRFDGADDWAIWATWMWRARG